VTKQSVKRLVCWQGLLSVIFVTEDVLHSSAAVGLLLPCTASPAKERYAVKERLGFPSLSVSVSLWNPLHVVCSLFLFKIMFEPSSYVDRSFVFLWSQLLLKPYLHYRLRWSHSYDLFVIMTTTEQPQQAPRQEE